MDKQNFETFIDYGSSKIRLGVFDKSVVKQNFFLEKKCLSDFKLKNFNIEESEKILEELVLQAEKKLGVHLKNINLMVDTPDLFSIDVSIKKELDGKKVDLDDVKYLLRDAKILIQNNYNDKKIIHIIVEKIIFDDQVFFSYPEEKIDCKKLILEIKFICFSNAVYKQINEKFKKNHLLISKIYCSSYVKSFHYNRLFDNYDKKFFLDIGYKKTCLTVFENKKLVFILTLPVGGNHITKDISKVIGINESDAEKIKCELNKSNTIFSDNSEEELLKRVIYARIDEILNLSLKNMSNLNMINENKKSILVFTGEGSKILDKNSIYLKDELSIFKDMNFYEENNISITQSGFNFNKSDDNFEVNIVPKKLKKLGFFERFFHFFS